MASDNMRVPNLQACGLECSLKPQKIRKPVKAAMHLWRRCKTGSQMTVKVPQGDLSVRL